jgi:predicted nucleotidyltransferase
MENELLDALKQVLQVLEKQEYRYAIIGGIANQIWGQARFTYDIDIKVLVPDTDYDSVRETLVSAFPESGRPEMPLNPLIVSVKIHNVIVDFLLSTPGYEEQIVHRAVKSIIAGLSVWVCSAEDLIIQKALANREKDWQDIEGIVIEQGEQLEQEYIEEWLTQFADILEQPELLNRYQHIRQKTYT